MERRRDGWEKWRRESSLFSRKGRSPWWWLADLCPLYFCGFLRRVCINEYVFVLQSRRVKEENPEVSVVTYLVLCLLSPLHLCLPVLESELFGEERSEFCFCGVGKKEACKLGRSWCLLTYWVCQELHSGFSMTSYGKIQKNILANSVLWSCVYWGRLLYSLNLSFFLCQISGITVLTELLWDWWNHIIKHSVGFLAQISCSLNLIFLCHLQNRVGIQENFSLIFGLP